MTKALWSTLCACVLSVVQAQAQDYIVNIETWPVQRFLTEVEYGRTSKSRVADYVDGAPYRLDQPNPLRLPLPWGMSEGITVTFADNENYADAREMAVESGQTEVIVYNLVPQHTYYYKMEDALGQVVAEGQVQTRGQVRMIYAPSIYNARDMGGWRTDDGLRVKYGKLYRGSELNRVNTATDEDLKLFRQLGVEAELDIRSEEERSAIADADHSAFGFSAADDTYLSTQYFGCYSYHLIGSSYIAGYKAALDFVIKSLKAGRPVYCHCIHGADRTGLLAIFIEGVLGVSYDQITKDYELTSMSQVGERIKTRYYDAIINYMSRFPGQTLQERMAYYLRVRVGLTADDIAYLRSALLEDPNQRPADSGVATGMEQIVMVGSGRAACGAAYSLSGRRCDVKRGLKIVRGRKYVVR